MAGFNIQEGDGARLGWSRSSRGFTLVELLVALSIIGVLLGLLIPAVQVAREAARRAECISNLRQIGIAMNAYHSVHNMFPTLLPDRSGHYGANHLSELVFLLPHLEQTVLYNSVNMSFATIDSPETPLVENGTARRARVSAFLCPSDGEPQHRNSYRFNRGRFRARPGVSFDGPFYFPVLPSATSITDGLSRTAFVSERVGGSFEVGSWSPRRDLRYPDAPGYMIMSDETFIPFCLSHEPAVWNVVAGRYWFYGGFVNCNYNHNGSPNDKRPSCFDGGPGNWSAGGLSPPRSYHPNGVNVLLGDGHVEWIGDSIQTEAWQAMGTHNAGDNY